VVASGPATDSAARSEGPLCVRALGEPWEEASPRARDMPERDPVARKHRGLPNHRSAPSSRYDFRS